MTLTEAYPARHWPAWIAGHASDEGNVAEVLHPGDGSVVGTYTVPDAASVETAMQGAWDALKAGLRSSGASRMGRF